MKVAVTGGTGFIGSALLQRLTNDGHEVVASVRRLPQEPIPAVTYVEGVDLPEGRWSEVVSGVDVVIHTAARVHVMHEKAADPLSEFRRANVEGTLRLAAASAEAGVRRLIYLSSIKVNGETTSSRQPFHADDIPQPTDAYGISKMEAEANLLEFGTRSGLEITIVRPPLVYGHGVKANFRTMMQLLNRRIPLPFGAVDAKRSLVALDNLVDLMVRCLDHPAAAGRIFLVSDGEDLGVGEILRRLGTALGRSPVLVPVPPALIDLVARMLGRADISQRLLHPLQVDIGPTRAALAWSPPVSVDEAFARTARAFLADRQ